MVLIDREVEGVELISRGESYTPAIELTDHLIAHGHTAACRSGPRLRRERVRGFKAHSGGAACRFRATPARTLTRSGGAEEPASSSLPKTHRQRSSPATAIAAGVMSPGTGSAHPRGPRIGHLRRQRRAIRWAFYPATNSLRAIGAAALRFLLTGWLATVPVRGVLRGDVRLRASCGCGRTPPTTGSSSLPRRDSTSRNRRTACIANQNSCMPMVALTATGGGTMGCSRHYLHGVRRHSRPCVRNLPVVFPDASLSARGTWKHQHRRRSSPRARRPLPSFFHPSRSSGLPFQPERRPRRPRREYVVPRRCRSNHW